jgi:hypothetical protein
MIFNNKFFFWILIIQNFFTINKNVNNFENNKIQLKQLPCSSSQFKSKKECNANELFHVIPPLETKKKPKNPQAFKMLLCLYYFPLLYFYI